MFSESYDADNPGLFRSQLRQHKSRIVSYVEDVIPNEVLELGTSVVVVQADGPTPGSHQTNIAIVFPKPEDCSLILDETPRQLIEGLEESGRGGTFRTKIMKPVADVKKQDVLDALPPQFPGGRRTSEKLHLQARDMTISYIAMLTGDNDKGKKKKMAEYIIESLENYISLGCIAPEIGRPYPPIEKKDSIDLKKENDRTKNPNFLERDDLSRQSEQGSGAHRPNDSFSTDMENLQLTGTEQKGSQTKYSTMAAKGEASDCTNQCSTPFLPSMPFSQTDKKDKSKNKIDPSKEKNAPCVANEDKSQDSDEKTVDVDTVDTISSSVPCEKEETDIIALFKKKKKKNGGDVVAKADVVVARAEFILNDLQSLASNEVATSKDVPTVAADDSSHEIMCRKGRYLTSKIFREKKGGVSGADAAAVLRDVKAAETADEGALPLRGLQRIRQQQLQKKHKMGHGIVGAKTM